jgi:hypothetical protein
MELHAAQTYVRKDVEEDVAGLEISKRKEAKAAVAAAPKDQDASKAKKAVSEQQQWIILQETRAKPSSSSSRRQRSVLMRIFYLGSSGVSRVGVGLAWLTVVCACMRCRWLRPASALLTAARTRLVGAAAVVVAVVVVIALAAAAVVAVTALVAPAPQALVAAPALAWSWPSTMTPLSRLWAKHASSCGVEVQAPPFAHPCMS